MNILLANISILPREKIEKEYSVLVNDCSIKSVKAFQTNESILKTVIELNELKKTGGLGKIIALVSQKVCNVRDEKFSNKTAFQYYEEKVAECSPNTKIEQILLEDDSEKESPIAEVLDKICQKINHDDTVYIDFAGGKRTTSNLVQLLAKLLKYKGIKNPYTLYADINAQNSISTTTEFLKVSEFADGLNEFMTSGRTFQLQSFFSDYKSPEIKNLLKAITDFSDKIQLGNIEKLGESIKELKIRLLEFKSKGNESDIGSVILRQFLPVIQEKLIGSTDTKIDYLRIINWCLDNMLIQQALTIFVEKIPVYIFDHGIIKYAGNEKVARLEHEDAKKKNKNISSDWETFVFYTDMLDVQSPLLKEMREYLEKDIKPTDKKCQEIVSVLQQIGKNWNSNKIVGEFSYLSDVIKDNNYKNYTAFKNHLKVNKRLLSKMLNLPEKEAGENSFENKFDGIKKIKSGYIPIKYIFHADNDVIARIYYGYMYVKSLRNQTNHASSEENLTPQQKIVLSNEGIDCSQLNLKTVQKNMKFLLNMIKDADDAFNKKLSEEAASDIIPTTLKVGDVVKARCTDKKIVRLENHNYDIQLVIAKGVDSSQFLNKTLEVQVKQISKVGKIIQVQLFEK